jgi:hypothetical protein
MKRVIDQDTRVDFIRMQLIQDLDADLSALMGYTLRILSPHGPVAQASAVQIERAIASVPG